jgi:DNA polymerase-3 subunit delta
MMTSRRVVVLRDFDKLPKEIVKKIAKTLSKTPETTLVIVEGENASIPGAPKALVKSESFKPIYESKLPSWIRNRFRKRGKKVDDKAIALLINNVGTPLGELNGEIEKVLIIAQEHDLVTEEDVRQVVGEFKRDTVWGLCNAVGLGDFKGSVKILENLMENEKNKETWYVSQLFSHIIKISEYNRLKKKGIPHEEAMKVVASSPFLWNLNRLNEQTHHMTHRSVQRALNVLSRTESALKRSRIDKKLLMELALPFIMQK